MFLPARFFARPFLAMAALLALAACGGGGGGSSSGPGPTATVTVSPGSATLTVSTTRQFSASVTNASSSSVTWSVQEGSAGGSIDASGRYTAPAAPGTYHVVATSTAVTSASGSATVIVVPAPAISGFTASPATITSGSASTLTATFTGGSGSVDQGLGTVTSGTGVGTGNLTATTTYTLTVTNAAGTSVTAPVTVTVVAAPAISGFAASPALILGGAASTLTATFSGGTGTIDHGVGAVTSGTGISTGSLVATTTFTLTVTNAANISVTAQFTVTVVTAPPTINAFTANPPTLTVGDSTTLAWTLSGQPFTSLTISPTIGDVTSLSSTQASPTTATTYTLTATNPAGSATATVSVSVVFAPTITSFTASPTTVVPGGTSTLTAVFAHGTGVLTPGNIPLTSGVGVATGALSADTAYTLTVTNTANSSVQQTLTVWVDPGTFTPAGTTMSVAREFPTATLMANGRVLVASGTSATTSADEFDPAANAGLGGFSASANGMAVVRLNPSSVLLPTGKVLVVGGYNPSAASPRQLASADLYDPATRTFTPSASHLATARQQFTATLLLNGKVLIAGGFNDTNHITLGSAELYDPATDTFLPSAATLGTPRWGAFATLLPSGKVLIVGGSSSSGTLPGAELYDPQLDTFLPTGGSNLDGTWNVLALLSSGKALVALSGATVSSNSLLYDPASGLATATTGMPDSTRVQFPTGTVLGDGRVLVAGNLGNPGMDVAGDCELFNPATQLYHYTANPGDRWAQATTLLPDGRALLVGGWDTGLSAPLATGTLFNAGPAVPAAAPTATVTPSATTAIAGTAGLTASVPATSGATYVWIISNGTITSGLGTATVTFTAGAAGTLQVDCLVVSPYGIPAHGSAQVAVTP